MHNTAHTNLIVALTSEVAYFHRQLVAKLVALDQFANTPACWKTLHSDLTEHSHAVQNTKKPLKQKSISAFN